MSAYNDKNISLKNIALTQFEMSREIPAALDLFANKPQNLDIQTRMIILKVNATLHNFKVREKLTLAIGLDFLSFLNPMMRFLHGNKMDQLEVLSFQPDAFTKETKILQEINSYVSKENFYESDAEIINAALKKGNFLIAILGAHAVNPARECLDAFSHGLEGLLLIHNYAIEKAPSHHLYAVERGLRILENPDGSGECYCVIK